MTAAARMRRSRARRREGRRVFRVEADVAELEIALQLHGHLSPTEDDPRAVEQALAALVRMFCAVTRNGADR